ncbi:hypothetical protein G4223_03655, partial [Magnetospirillum aberrantis SpK]|nr:hypothetical protein [Magnetospirillum aberrantis SpK]
ATILLNQRVPYTGLVTTVAVGGTASTLAGGTFEQGAMTAGLGYLYNACLLGKNGCMILGGVLGTSAGAVAAAACDAGTMGACVAANPAMIGAAGSGGAALGAALDIVFNTNIGPYGEPVIVGDSKGNNIPLAPGEQIQGSPNGDYVQVKDPRGKPTGVRGDYGGHPNQADPAAQEPHAHRPGVTQPDGNPHLPVYR